MSLSPPPDCVRMIGELAPPICQSLDTTREPATIVVVDRPHSFMDVLMRCCAAGAPAPAHIYRAHPRAQALVGAAALSKSPIRLAALDGLGFDKADAMLLPAPAKAPAAPRVRLSLDRVLELLANVQAIGFGLDAMQEELWRGALAFIQREQPVLVGMITGLRAGAFAPLEAFGYRIIRHSIWGYPQRADVFAVALPPRLTAASVAEGGPRNVILPAPIADRSGADDLIGNHAVRFAARFAPSQLEAVSGLHPPEVDGALQWVWTGPTQRAEFILPQLWHGPHTFKLGAADTKSPRGFDGLRFQINGRPISDAVWKEAICHLPANLAPSEFTGEVRICVVTPSPQRASLYDDRVLGTSITGVEVLWS